MFRLRDNTITFERANDTTSYHTVHISNPWVCMTQSLTDEQYERLIMAVYFKRRVKLKDVSKGYDDTRWAISNGGDYEREMLRKGYGVYIGQHIVFNKMESGEFVLEVMVPERMALEINTLDCL